MHLSSRWLPQWLVCFLAIIVSQTSMGAEEVRWLFVVDTSISMRKKHENIYKIVQEVFADEFNGLIREKERIDLWTFREELNTNAFKGISWNKVEKESSILSVTQFLKAQRYSGQTRFLPVVQAIQGEAYKSRTLVAFLITDGDDNIQGTPYDGPLNGDFLLYRSNFRRRKLPFVTMLVYQRGYCVAARVHPGLGKIAIPIQRLPPPMASPPLPEESEPEDKPSTDDQKLEHGTGQAKAIDPMKEPAPNAESEAAKESIATKEPPAERRETANSLLMEVTTVQEDTSKGSNGAGKRNVQAEETGKTEANNPSEPVQMNKPMVQVAEPSSPEEAHKEVGSSSSNEPHIAEAIPPGLPQDEKGDRRKVVINGIVFTIGLMAIAGLIWIGRQRRSHTSLISESLNKR